MPLEALSLELCLDSLQHHIMLKHRLGSHIVTASICSCLCTVTGAALWVPGVVPLRMCMPLTLDASGNTTLTCSTSQHIVPCMLLQSTDEGSPATPSGRRALSADRRLSPSYGLKYAHYLLKGQERSPAIAPGRRRRALLPACEPQSRLIPRLGAELSRHSTLLSTPSRL